MERKDLTKLQAFALEEMLEGKNVFLTGEAGTGKSEVIKMFIADREKAGKNILITAPTGTAADNLGGETIHRAFGAPVGVIANSKPVKKREEGQGKECKRRSGYIWKSLPNQKFK